MKSGANLLTTSALFLLWVSIIPASQEQRYAAPRQSGDGSGETESNPAAYNDSDFWDDISSHLDSQPVTVHLAAGEYVGGSLNLHNIGHPTHRLTVQGAENDGTVMLFPAGEDATSGPTIRRAQNVTIRDLYFTGEGRVGYASQVRESRNIEFFRCKWIDIPNVHYGASGTLEDQNPRVPPEEAPPTRTRDITFRECVFQRIGTRTGAHMIYNAHRPQYLRFIDSHFEDCSGDYLRFRDRVDHAVVWGCTFVSTGTWPPSRPSHMPFISFPLFADSDPGDEWFGTNYLIANNTFKYAQDVEVDESRQRAIMFLHTGFDPTARRHLMTEEDGRILSYGSPEEKRTLIAQTTQLDGNSIRFFGNMVVNADIDIAFGSFARYGAESRGWEGFADITDIVNDEPIGLADWLSVSRLVFSDDFESAPSTFTHQRLELVQGEGVAGSTGLRATYIGNEVGSARIVRQHALPEKGTEYTLSYDVKFHDDFQFVRGGKLHGLGPSRPITGGNPMRPDGWSARVTFGPDGRIRTYLYNQSQTGQYGTTKSAPDFRFERGRYHAVSLHVKLNDPEEANGFAHIYVDGEKVVSHDDVQFRGEDGDHTLIDRVLFSTFHGGSNPDWAPKTEDGEYTTVHATFDNFAVHRGGFVRMAAGE